MGKVTGNTTDEERPAPKGKVNQLRQALREGEDSGFVDYACDSLIEELNNERS